MSSQPHTGLLKKPLALCIGLVNTQLAFGLCQIDIDALEADDTALTTTFSEAIVGLNHCPDNEYLIKVSEQLAGKTELVNNRMQLDGGKTVTLEGPTAGSFTVQADNTEASLLQVDESSSLTVRRLVFAGRDGIQRSAELMSVNNSDLTLESVTVRDLDSTSDRALIEARNSDVVIKESTISGNKSRRAPIHVQNSDSTTPLPADGKYRLTVQDTQFQGNQANGSFARGGALETSDVELDIADSVFEGNETLVDNQYSRGGAIRIFSEYGNTKSSIRGTTFKNNQTYSYGGAIAKDGTTALEISDSLFDSNQVLALPNEYGTGLAAEAHGGAISTNETSELKILRTTFKSNQAKSLGGALYFFGDATSGQIDIADSTFDSNQALFSASEATVPKGGALAVVTEETSSSLNISGSTFMDNHSDGSAGVLFVDRAVDTNIINSTLVANESDDGSSVASFQGSNGKLSIRHSTITDNAAVGGEEGNTVFMNTPAADLEISHSVFHNNTVPDGKAKIVVAESEYSAQVEFTYWDGSYSGTQNASDNGGNIVSSDDPGLAALQDNGGETPTRMPQTGSSLINAGDANIENEPDTDQRGSQRIDRGVIDIGAVEYGNQIPQVVITPTDISLTEGDAINLDVSVWFSDGNGDDLTYGMQGAPDQVNLDSNSGLITGTAQGVGDYTITITATDEFGSQASASVTVAVQPKPVDEPNNEDSEEPPAIDEGSSSGGGALFWLLGLLSLALRRR